MLKEGFKTFVAISFALATGGLFLFFANKKKAVPSVISEEDRLHWGEEHNSEIIHFQ